VARSVDVAAITVVANAAVIAEPLTKEGLRIAFFR
jgi:hypothetical protein